MFKIVKQLTSLVAVFAVLFAFTTETMAIVSVVNANRTANTATKEVNCFTILNIISSSCLLIYLLTNNSKLNLNC